MRRYFQPVVKNQTEEPEPEHVGEQSFSSHRNKNEIVILSNLSIVPATATATPNSAAESAKHEKVRQDDSPPSKISKTISRAFCTKWIQDPIFNGWLQKNCEKDPKFPAYCKACHMQLQIKSGKSDLLTHARTTKHITNIKAVQLQPSIVSCFNSFDGIRKSVIKAELQNAALIAEHNLAFNLADHLVKMEKSSFPDSKVSAEMHSNRIKSTCLVKNVLGAQQFENIIAILKHNKFSICADESTDISCKKVLSIVARTSIDFKVYDFLLDLIEVDSADANSLYNSITKVFIDNEINYKKNLIGFAADGANNMTGRNHSVASLLNKDCENLIVFKCICHSFALCSSYACLKLPSTVESMVRDIYNYVQNSPKRSSQFADILTLLEENPRKILQPCQTRWLSLESVVNRIISLYEPLKIYFGFAANVDQIDNAEIILQNLKNPTNLLYLKFLKFILPKINLLNKIFQSEKPQVHKMYDEVNCLVRTILDNFIKPECLRQKSIDNINFKHPYNIINLENLYLGVEVKLMLGELSESMNLIEIQTFKNNCIFFYTELCDQIFKRFDFKNNILKSIALIDPKKIINREINSLTDLFKLFPNLVSEKDLQSIDCEFREIINLDFDNLFSDSVEKIEIEYFWKRICTISRGDESLAFPLMGKFIFNILALPNSSANVERTFSQINLNKTKTRNRLATDTIKGILYTKDYLRLTNSCCYNIEIKKELVQKYSYKNLYK